jgi:hypothetical protein
MVLRGRHCRSRPPQLLHNSGPLDFCRTHSGLGVLILNPTTLLAKTDFQLRSTRIIQDPFRLGSLPQIPHTLLDCRDTDFQLRSTQSLQDPFRLGILNPQFSHVASLQRQIFKFRSTRFLQDPFRFGSLPSFSRLACRERDFRSIGAMGSDLITQVYSISTGPN